jgi:hypothetical protein
MKWMSILLATLLIFSCKKEKTNNTSLVGKWKMIETYEGRVGGGCMCWEPIMPDNAPTLQYFLLGRYTFTYPSHLSVPGCSGDYRIVNNSTIAMTYECQSGPTYKVNYSFSRDGNTLTLTHWVHGGVLEYIVYKYRKL